MDKKSSSSFQKDLFNQVDLGGQLADLKINSYHHSLLLTALIDLLIQKKLIKHEELKQITRDIDRELMSEISPKLDDLT